ncbi:MAG: hypothetical protein H6717_30735 [Polyangiaceae bacterium]|nr:hypothetical protein [Polyangiaceae bacterium]
MTAEESPESGEAPPPRSEPSDPEKAAERWAPEVMARFKRGEKGEQVVIHLVQQGLDEHEVKAAFERAIQLAKHERRGKNRLYGGLWLASGALMTWLSFRGESSPLHYVLAFGALGFGLYQIVKSFR